MNVASCLSRCCKSGSRCCIYIHVAIICLKCFQVFHMYVCKCFMWILHMFAMVFKCFSGVFASVSNACFKCFICLPLYVATVASGCLKIDQVLHMGCAWEAAGGVDDIHSGVGDIRCCAGPLLVHSLASLTR